MARPQLMRSLLSIGAAWGLAGCSLMAQNSTTMQKLNSTELSRLRVAVAKPVPVTLWTVSEDFTANFDNIGEKFNEFSNEFRNQKVDSQVKVNPTPVMILQEDPTGKSEFRVTLGVQVPKKVEVKSPLKVEQVEKPQAVRYTHTGPWQSLKPVHDGIDNTLKTRAARANAAGTTATSTSWPVVVRLLNDPRKVPASQIRTEMIVPVS